MDRVDKERDSGGLRRSTRQLRNKEVFRFDLKPRRPIKRKRRLTDVTTNENYSTEEGPPSKITNLQIAQDAVDGYEKGDQNNPVEMVVEEFEDQDQDMSSVDESDNCEPVMNTLNQEQRVNRILRVGNLETEEMKAFLQQKEDPCQKSWETELPKLTGNAIHGSEIELIEPSRTVSASVNLKPVENRMDVLTVRSSIREYQNKIAEKARGVDLQVIDRYPYVKGHTEHIPKTNNLLAEKLPVHHAHTELRKQVITKTVSTSTSTANAWGICRWLLWAVFLMTLLALGLMGYQHFPFTTRTTEHENRLLSSATLEKLLAELKPFFPSQRTELWKRAEIHLKRHINLTDPTEPVSLILTSGHAAERTLGCLAQQLAAAFSIAHNSTVLAINGTSKSEEDSDQVKLDIDKALKEAFEGGIQAAVIHHFEDLPPGSTLIFYRYCDHENAAFKKVFLAFTVMLPVPEIDFSLSLKVVEEQVQEYLTKKFVSDRTVEFNKMDVDKLSGLWSRISHLILPVAAEQKIEQNGCWV